MKELNVKLINRLVLLILVIVLYYALEYIGIISKLKDLLFALIPMYIAVFISWLMRPVAIKLHKKFKINLKLASALSIIINFIFIFVILFIVIPFSIVRVVDLLQNANVLIEGIKQTFIGFASLFKLDTHSLLEVFDLLSSNFNLGHYSNLLISWFTNIISIFGNVVSVILQVIIGYVIAFYLMPDIKYMVIKTVSLFASKNNISKILDFLYEVSHILRGYFRGLFIVSGTVFIVVSVGCMFIGIPYPFLFGFIAGVLNVIPFLGPILGGIPIFIVALSMGLNTALWSLFIVFGTQFLESNFLQPKIMSKYVEVHPFFLITGLIIFSTLFGFFGIIICTPAMGVLKVLLDKYQENRLKECDHE